MGGDDYKFMKIADAMASINQRVNLAGVVTETSIPKTSKGTDFFSTVKIIDDSWPAHGICVNFFANTIEKLPNSQRIGDIILLSVVLVKTRGREIYATFEKKYSSFALFEGNDRGTGLMPYQTSARYKARDEDKKLVTGLRKWFSEYEVEGLNKSLYLREIKEAEHLNLICRILHVSEVEDGVMLYVWDGTDTPPRCVQSNLENELRNPLPLQLDSPLLSRVTLCTFPTVGSVLRMKLYYGDGELGIKILKTDTWAFFVNIKCEVHDALWLGVMTPRSKLSYLADDHDRVIECQRRHEERVQSNFDRMPFTSFPWPSTLTEIDHPDVPFVTLMDIITFSKVIYKYSCVVRVVAMVPWKVKDFRAPSGMYRVRLTLEDPTARIHAFIYEDDGIKFFGNSNSVAETIKAKNSLLGIAGEDETTQENVSRDPPWVRCCMYSYYTDKDDMWGTRNYRIFDTTLLG